MAAQPSIAQHFFVLLASSPFEPTVETVVAHHMAVPVPPQVRNATPSLGSRRPRPACQMDKERITRRSISSTCDSHFRCACTVVFVPGIAMLYKRDTSGREWSWRCGEPDAFHRLWCGPQMETTSAINVLSLATQPHLAVTGRHHSARLRKVSSMVVVHLGYPWHPWRLLRNPSQHSAVTTGCVDHRSIRSMRWTTLE